jgi:hypothetical protein
MLKRQVELYVNETVGSMFWAYHPDAILRCAYRGTMELPADDQQALNQIFSAFNRDERPDGYRDRSLSVGDVVTLDSQSSYAVAGVGFEPLGRVRTGDGLVDFETWEKGQTGRGRHQLPQPWPPFGGRGRS